MFLATGTGVAPFIGMAREAMREQVPALLVLGVPKEEDIPYRKYFDQLHSEYELFTPLYVLSRPDPSWTGARGYVTDQFTGTLEEWLRVSDVYVCGVPMMVEGTIDMLRRVGVPKQQTFVQKFG
jgi:NAD(P)H-flavin reductase